MHPWLIESQPHGKMAGLQLADVVASAFRFAADTDQTRLHNLENAKSLKPRMWSKGGWHAYNGVTLLPWSPAKAKLTPKQKEIFQFYGYRI